jgi:hypothetical protein
MLTTNAEQNLLLIGMIGIPFQDSRNFPELLADCIALQFFVARQPGNPIPPRPSTLTSL